jgi:hypothetical protein
MKSSIESLESRRLFAIATAAVLDYSSLIRDEQNIPSVFTSASRANATINGAIHRDLLRLNVYKTNYSSLVVLAKDEATDILHLRKDVLLLEVAVNHDTRTLIVRGQAGQQHSSSIPVLNAFSATLTKLEQDVAEDFQKIAMDSVTASTGASVSQLNLLAAADAADTTLASDVQSGVSNLQSFSTALTNSLVNYNSGIATLVNDAAGIAVFGSEGFFGQQYPAKANPYEGTALTGLAPNVSTVAISKFVAPATFAPIATDYPGTDQIYVGSNEIPGADQLVGPQVITLDYSALTKLSHPIKTFTLGIATDGFEDPTTNIPYTVSINGVVNTTLTSILNNLNDADRVEQFVSIGIDPAQLSASKVLTISIDSPGNDVSGWAVDFLTVGIQNG